MPSWKNYIKTQGFMENLNFIKTGSIRHHNGKVYEIDYNGFTFGINCANFTIKVLQRNPILKSKRVTSKIKSKVFFIALLFERAYSQGVASRI